MIRRLLLSLCLIIFSATFLSAPVSAFNPIGSVCGGGGAQSSVCQAPNTDPVSGSGGILHKVARWVAIFAGVAGVIMVVIAGFMYVTSGGDPSRTASAKNTLLYAVIGLVVAAFAQAIVLFTVNKVG